jgi:hypothetical protein
MIPSSVVQRIINFTRKDITRVAIDSGYLDEYLSTEFIGINSSSQFMFEVIFMNDIEGTQETGLVYIGYDDEGLYLEY